MIKQYNKFNENINQYLKGPSEEEIVNAIKAEPEKYIKNFIKDGNIDFIKIAIKNGVNINNKWSSYLHFAVLYKQIDIVKFLLRHGIDFDDYAIRRAYEEGDNDIAELILNHFHMTYEEFIKKYPQDYLYISVYNNKLEDVKKALTMEVDINNISDGFLYQSIRRKYNEVALCLILHGAKVDIDDLNKIAKLVGNTEMLEILKNY